MRQFVLVLRDIAAASSYKDSGPDLLAAEWTVVHLDRIEPESLLRGGPTTAALAALGAGDVVERAQALVAAGRVIGRERDRDRRDVLIGAARTLASITLPPHVIMESVKEAAMPVPIKETPLGEYLMEEGRVEGRAEAERDVAMRFTRALLRRRFGDDPRIDGAAARLAEELPEDDRVARILDAPDLASLT